MFIVCTNFIKIVPEFRAKVTVGVYETERKASVLVSP